jgi:transposase
MWTVEQRQARERAGLRHPSDLTDAGWALVEPFIPPARRGGRRRTVDVREVPNGLFYVLATGCQWRALPKDLPPRSTVHGYLTLRAWDGTLWRLHHALFVQAREQVGKEASPTVAIIDSQSVKGAEKGALASVRRATTRARRSGARSGTSSSTRWVFLVDTLGLPRRHAGSSSSTRWVFCRAPPSIPPASRTGTGPCRSCGPHAGCPRSSR